MFIKSVKKPNNFRMNQGQLPKIAGGEFYADSNREKCGSTIRNLRVTIMNRELSEVSPPNKITLSETES